VANGLVLVELNGAELSRSPLSVESNRRAVLSVSGFLEANTSGGEGANLMFKAPWSNARHHQGCRGWGGKQRKGTSTCRVWDRGVVLRWVHCRCGDYFGLWFAGKAAAWRCVPCRVPVFCCGPLCP
jgi:hypothetical protein